MRIEDLWNIGQVSPLANGAQPKQIAEEQYSAPSSWAADRVQFSAEAMAAQRAAEAEKKNAEEEAGASGAFKKYMVKARGKLDGTTGGGGGGGGVEEQIKALQEKAADLTSQIASTASSNKITGEAKDSHLQTLNGELNQVMAQIAELQSQIAEESA